MLISRSLEELQVMEQATRPDVHAAIPFVVFVP